MTLGIGTLTLSCPSPGGAATASTTASTPPTTITIADVPYSTLSPQDVLDVVEPAQPGTDRYAVVLVHGGGFSEGSLASMSTLATDLAEAGFVVFNINYRLNGFPNESDDVMTAVQWVRADAAEYGVDPTRIAVMGTSAGGNLAGMVATEGAANGAPVSAAVSWSGEMDLAALVGEEAAGSYDVDHVEAYLGGCSPSQCPATYTAASPVFQVTPETSPMMIVNSTNESNPLSQATEMDQALVANNVPQELLEPSGKLHGIALLPVALTPTIDFLDQYLQSNPVSPAGAPPLTLAETAVQPNFSLVGQTLDYDYVVTN
ncbi:MAG: alpha/beta hydrolase, partial [Acidimicrobiales bacterium]